jgi:capping protein (actin filament) muscle Z-line, beta
MSEILTSGLTLMRRMPPALAEKSLVGLSKLIEDEALVDQAYQRVDKPLNIERCASTGGEFILCEFNKDGDSYRSPWSNLYQPPIAEATQLSETLRKLEIQANNVFNEYRRLYYEGGVSSVYFWDVGSNAFASAFLIKKDIEPREGVTKGSWESTNLVEAVITPESRSVRYNITSTVFLQISTSDPNAGVVDLSGSLTRQIQEHKPCSDPFGEGHVYNIIALVENIEGKLRSSLDLIYIGKTKEILDRTRHIEVERTRVKLA